MKKIIPLLLILVFLLPLPVWAHITNEQNLYDDIQYSEARDATVILSGLGVIPSEHGAALFRPKDKLTRAELAYWAGTFLKASKDQTADPKTVQQAALQQGIVSTLEGAAALNDVNQAYFGGLAPKLEQPEGEVTKEAFAVWMYGQLSTRVDGRTLFDRAGFEAGPAGVVEDVTVKEAKAANGAAVKTVTLQVNGQAYALGEHPKLVHASVEPSDWKGRTIQASWTFKAADGKPVLQLLTFAGQTSAGGQQGLAADRPATAGASTGTGTTAGAGAAAGAGTSAGASTNAGAGATAAGAGTSAAAGHAGHAAGAGSGNSAAASAAEAGPGFPVVPVLVVAILAFIAGWVFMAKRKTSKTKA